MGYHPKKLGAFTFAASESNFLRYTEDCELLAVFATSSSGVFTVQVSNEDTTSTGAGVWQDYQPTPGTDLAVTAINAISFSPGPVRRIRLLSTFGSTGSTGLVTGAGGTGFPVTGQIKI